MATNRPNSPARRKISAEHCETTQRVLRGIKRIREETADAPLAPRWVIPLNDIISRFELTVHEINKLTYERAARFVSERTGREIFVPSGFAESDRLAGLLLAYAKDSRCQGHILVQRDDPVERRRFSVGHELGHFILHLLLIVEETDSETIGQQLALVDGFSFGRQDDSTTAADDYISQAEYASVTGANMMLPTEAQMEREADAFAAALLMPEDSCRSLFKKHRRDYGESRSVLARRMATDLLVSKSAMLRRLETLDLGR